MMTTDTDLSCATRVEWDLDQSVPFLCQLSPLGTELHNTIQHDTAWSFCNCAAKLGQIGNRKTKRSVQRGGLNQLDCQGADQRLAWLAWLAGKEMCSSKQRRAVWRGAESDRSLGIACCSACAALVKPGRVQVEFRFGD